MRCISTLAFVSMGSHVVDMNRTVAWFWCGLLWVPQGDHSLGLESGRQVISGH